jgi:cytochrome c oxidase accessory protein FixG
LPFCEGDETGKNKDNMATFRDELGVLNKSGGRLWMYPKPVNGFYYWARNAFAVLLLVFLFGMPFVKLNGEPFLLFNIFERKFIIFGVFFHPQDFYIIALSMVTAVLCIVLFTVVFGRVFCGWACPQTIFMEMIFRRIEYWIEGDHKAQKRLNASPWTAEKIIKKSLKWSVFFGISFVIANTFLAYLIGIDNLKMLVSDGPLAHLGTFVLLLVFTGAFYTVFAYVRELVCIVACPYGRLQSVMLDNNSIVVAYDFVRGEPRGKSKKGNSFESGDCVDCGHCVHVCPTGIDIRNGTQLECINCTACIDACDEVMVKVKKPKGLIRYASLNHIKEGKKNSLITTRSVAYSAVILVLMSITASLFFGKKEVSMVVLRAPGQLFQKVGQDKISNLYNVDFVSNSPKAQQLSLRVKDLANSEIKLIGSDQINLAANETGKATFFVVVPEKELPSGNTKINIELLNNEGKVLNQISTSFLGPIKPKNKN